MRGTNRPILLFALVGLLAVPVAAARQAGDPTNPYTEPAPRCVVPALRGKTLPEAKRLVVRAGCKLGVVTKRPAAKAKIGKVLSQAPAPGKRFKSPTAVSLSIGRRA